MEVQRTGQFINLKQFKLINKKNIQEKNITILSVKTDMQRHMGQRKNKIFLKNRL